MNDNIIVIKNLINNYIYIKSMNLLFNKNLNKWIYSIFFTILFLFFSSSITYSITNKIFKNTLYNNCPTIFGIIVHSIILLLLIRFSINRNIYEGKSRRRRSRRNFSRSTPSRLQFKIFRGPPGPQGRPGPQGPGIQMNILNNLLNNFNKLKNHVNKNEKNIITNIKKLNLLDKKINQNSGATNDLFNVLDTKYEPFEGFQEGLVLTEDQKKSGTIITLKNNLDQKIDQNSWSGTNGEKQKIDNLINTINNDINLLENKKCYDEDDIKELIQVGLNNENIPEKISKQFSESTKWNEFINKNDDNDMSIIEDKIKELNNESETTLMNIWSDKEAKLKEELSTIQYLAKRSDDNLNAMYELGLIHHHGMNPIENLNDLMVLERQKNIDDWKKIKNKKKKKDSGLE